MNVNPLTRPLKKYGLVKRKGTLEGSAREDRRAGDCSFALGVDETIVVLVVVVGDEDDGPS